ncbi:hypothetical protein [Nocardia wallacei]|uniref:hypothetical protein n=1 Tax=Nocardia wallacei TaxID=480035 RepID=UPI00245757D5|nr:hypothetical protein [Nocardia wallacei]
MNLDRPDVRALTIAARTFGPDVDSRVPEDATAFSGPRSPGWAINISAACPDPATFDAERAWVRELWDTLRVHARDDATYVNFLVENDPDRTRRSYGARNTTASPR